MRYLILASTLLVAGLAVLLAVSTGHKRVAAQSAQSQQPPQQQPTPADGVRRVTIQELREAMDKGTAIVVDVRSAEQFKAGHIKGAVWIPGNEIGGRTKELPKDKLIVTYCS